MEYLKWILFSLVILGLFNTGLCKSTSRPDDYEESPQEDEDDYIDEDSSKNNEPPEHNDVIGDAPPPYFLARSITVNATKGEDVILRCDAKNLLENHIVMWYNGSQLIATGKNVINGEKVTSLDKTTIRIHNVEYSDRNQYVCSILPHRVNLTILLNVIHEKRAVAIYSHGRDVTERSMTFRQGDDVEFECRPIGMDNAQIKWSLNGERASNHVTVTENGRIIIKSIDEHQAGIYQCLGDDGTNNALPHGSLTINVQYSPKISTHRHYVNAAKDGHAELHCEYKAEPIAVVEWKKLNSETKQLEIIPSFSDKYLIRSTSHKGKNTTTLLIKNIDSTDLGEYQCHAMNKIGSAHANIHLIFKPEKPRFEDKVIDDKTVILHWLVRSKQNITEAVIDYKVNGTHNKWTTDKILRTHPSDQHSGIWKLSHELELTPGLWHMRIKVKNSAGWSDFSDEETIKVEEPVESPPPEDIVYAGDIAGNKINNNNNNSSNRIFLVPLLLLTCLLSSLRIVPSV